MKEKAYLLLSGGVESAVALMCTRDDFRLIPVHFSYGQRAEVMESRHADMLTWEYLGDVERVEIEFQYPSTSVSSLLSSSFLEPEQNRSLNEIWSVKSHTHLPGRNILFLSFLMAMGESEGVHTVVTGFRVPGQNSVGSPDATEDFERAFTQMSSVYGWRMDIISPVQLRTKTRAVQIGLEHGLDMSLTYSCFVGSDPHCGKCDSCQMRRRAFTELGVKDPTEYAKF